MLFEGVQSGNDEDWIDQTILPLVEKALVRTSLGSRGNP